MNPNLLKRTFNLALLLAAMTASAEVTTFTYQGRLLESGSPATGFYDLRFRVWDAPSLGAPASGSQTANNVEVNNGGFSTELDFGALPFTGAERWLEIEVSPVGAGAFTRLTPRQRITANPYAIHAADAATLGGQAPGGYVLKAGDTMTGSLFLPADGLTVGTAQLKIVGGNVGIGNVTPGNKLDVAGTVAATVAVDDAVKGNSSFGRGVVGLSTNGAGVLGDSLAGVGVYGHSSSNHGVEGWSTASAGVYGSSSQNYGVSGVSQSSSGVDGTSGYGAGVSGYSPVGSGVSGVSSSGSGLAGNSTSGNGVSAFSSSAYGVFGQSDNAGGWGGLFRYRSDGNNSAYLGGNGYAGSFYGEVDVQPGASSAYGIHVTRPGTGGAGVYVDNVGAGQAGIKGTSANSGSTGIGVVGETAVGIGVYGIAVSPGGYGIYADSYSTAISLLAINRVNGYGCYFGESTMGADMYGPVTIHGPLSKPGGSFKIDHPLDPANKYLYHSFVESPDMKNIYDGVAVLDDRGEAAVTLPGWFEALNRDFRYQLTAVGAPGPNLHIAAEVAGNSFRIGGGAAGMKVSWQVTGIRKDAWANAHRIPVEQDKPKAERGSYLAPEEHGQSKDKSVQWARYPETKEMLKREPPANLVGKPFEGAQ